MPLNDPTRWSSAPDDSGSPPPSGSRRCRLVRRLATLVVCAGLFSGVMAAASMSPVAASYGEECVNEGCSGEEKNELWQSFQSECIDEGCFSEEVAELAGSDIYSDGTYTRPVLVRDLMAYFQTRTSTIVGDIAVKPGLTESFFGDIWSTILNLADGEVLGINCDYDTDPAVVQSCKPWRD